MIEKLSLYGVWCDKCGTRYNVAAPRSSLVTHLRMMGWRVNKDTAFCPDCVEKEVEGYK